MLPIAEVELAREMPDTPPRAAIGLLGTPTPPIPAFPMPPTPPIAAIRVGSTIIDMAAFTFTPPTPAPTPFAPTPPFIPMPPTPPIPSPGIPCGAPNPFIWSPEPEIWRGIIGGPIPIPPIPIPDIDGVPMRGESIPIPMPMPLVLTLRFAPRYGLPGGGGEPWPWCCWG